MADADSTPIVPATLPSGRTETSAVWDGQYAYVFGGFAGSYTNLLTQIVRFDPATNQVTDMALWDPNAKLPTGRMDTSAVWDPTSTSPCPTGCAYVFGGFDFHSHQSQIIRYSPGLNTVKDMATLHPDAHLPSGRDGTAAVWAGDSAYIFGGWDGSSALDQIVRYTPSTNQVDIMPSALPTGVYWASAVWDGTHAYIFGGAHGGPALDQIVRYDPQTGEVTDMATLDANARLPTGRYWTSAVWTGKSAYIFGGVDSTRRDKILRYDPATNTVATTSTTLPSVRSGTSAVWDPSSVGECPSACAYVFGGQTNSAYLDQIVSYAPAPPSAPQLLTAVPAGVGKILLQWQPPANNGDDPITSYLVYRGLSSNSKALVAAGGCSGLGNALTCTDAYCPFLTKCYYHVTAVTATEEGPPSNEASAMPVL